MDLRPTRWCLFDGKDMSKWNGADNWKVNDGIVIAGPGQVTSKDVFGDCQVHIEWTSDAKAEGTGQGRSNSGVFLMGKYEVQVLDSYDNETYYDGQCGAIYKQSPPLVNVCRKPGEWQTYDIIWKAPRFEDGKLVSPAFITVLHNGVVVQNHFQLEGDTPYNRPPAYEPHPDKGPIALAVPRQSGPLPQYLGARDQGTGKEACIRAQDCEPLMHFCEVRAKQDADVVRAHGECANSSGCLLTLSRNARLQLTNPVGFPGGVSSMACMRDSLIES